MLAAINRFFNRPTYINFFTLFIQLKALLESGISIIDAINKAAAAQSNKILKEALLQIGRDLRAGISTSVAFKNTNVFPHELPAIISAGEKSGELVKTFGNLANTMWLKATLYSKVNGALLTPKIAAFVGFIVFTLFSQVVMPKYEKMYADSGIEMPEVVQIFVSCSNAFFSYWYVTLLIIYGIYKAWSWFCIAKKDVLDRWKLHLFIYKDLHRRLIQHEFANNFSLMIGAGITASSACEMVSKIVSNSIMGKNIKAAGIAALSGMPIPAAFYKHNNQNTFDPMLLSFLDIGTETGMLPRQMDQIAKVYELEINSLVNSVGAKLTVLVITPMAFLIIGLYIMSLVPMLGYFNKISNM